MKVDNLLGPYLYQFKKLSLPGIGLFTLDEKAILPDENAKVKMAIEGISFVPKTGPQLDDSLVLYIKEHTGKMKPLAEADLYSFIATAFQYLNIGKPFYFEGIGTLQKTKDNTYNFTPGTIISKKEEITHKHIDTKRQPAETADIDIDEPVGRKSSFNAGRLVIALAVILTLAAVGWGGYYLYNKNTGASDSVIVKTETSPAASTDTTSNTATANTIDSSGKKPDSINNTVKTDSTSAKPTQTATTSIPTNGFKFILETTEKKARALKRFDQIKGSTMLKEYNNVAALETKDSVTFKIFTVVPCAVTDTAKVRDQLNAWYYGTSAIKVKLEQ